MKTTSLGPWLGINNRLPDFALHVDKTGDFLRDAENIDIDNKGNILRRRAASLVQAMGDAHSLHGNYLMRGSSLYAITLPSYTQDFAKLLSSDDKVSWLDVHGDTFYSNGTDSGRITGGLFYPLGMVTPAAPACVGVGGGMFAGRYKVAVAYRNSVTGEESGLSPATVHTLATDGGLRVTMPGASTGATHVNVYVSTLNSEIMFFAASYAIGTATVDFSTQPDAGRQGNERFEAPLPAGRLFISNNRLCSIAGPMIYVGLPYRYGYYLPASGYIPFPANVSIAIENQGGTYIAADKTYWLPGDLGNIEGPLRDVLPYGAVPGTEFRHPTEPTVGWFGADGFVLAGIDGTVKAATSDNIDLTAPAEGCATVRDSGGYLRVIACGWCMNLENAAATRYTGFDFTALSGDYGIADDGLYLLEGSGPVAAMAALGKNDFGSENEKRMPAIYLGCTGETPLELGITTPDAEDYRYAARSNGEILDIHRVDPGKGLKANWFDLTIRNVDGADFTLASVSFAPVASSRRI